VPPLSERYRAVVVGCGRIGSAFSVDARTPGIHSHAAAYRAHARTELVGLCDTDAARREAAAALWGVPAHADMPALCRDLAPDVVSICTPDATHVAVARSLLSAPRAPRLLFVEKPLATTAREGAELLELARGRDCTIVVNYSRRFSPAFQALRDELHAGEHGRPLLARAVYGKGLLHNGGHAIDLMRFWFGEPLKASGEARAWGPEGDETFSADLWFANDCRGRLEAFDERVATLFEMDVLCERSRWRFWAGGAAWEFCAVGASPRYAGYRAYNPTGRERTDARFAEPLAHGLVHAVDNIVGCLDGTAQARCSGADGLAVLSWVEAIRGAW
jgi:predicted dehydrogenase